MGVRLRDWYPRVLDSGEAVVEGVRLVDGTLQHWRSSALTKRVGARLVSTRSGSEYELLGPSDCRTAVHKGLAPAVAKAFENGFPAQWRTLLDGPEASNKGRPKRRRGPTLPGAATRGPSRGSGRSRFELALKRAKPRTPPTTPPDTAFARPEANRRLRQQEQQDTDENLTEPMRDCQAHAQEALEREALERKKAEREALAREEERRAEERDAAEKKRRAAATALSQARAAREAREADRAAGLTKASAAVVAERAEAVRAAQAAEAERAAAAAAAEAEARRAEKAVQAAIEEAAAAAAQSQEPSKAGRPRRNVDRKRYNEASSDEDEAEFAPGVQIAPVSGGLRTGTPWSAEELRALRTAHAVCIAKPERFWETVATKVGTRTSQECYNQWYKVFVPAKPEPKRKAKDRPRGPKGKVAGKNTAKYRRQVRDMFEEAEERHKDDLFESTPFKQKGGAGGVAADFDFDTSLPTPGTATGSGSGGRNRGTPGSSTAGAGEDSPLSSPDDVSRQVDRDKIDFYIAGLARRRKGVALGKDAQLRTPEGVGEGKVDTAAVSDGGVRGNFTPKGSVQLKFGDDKFAYAFSESEEEDSDDDMFM